MREKTVRYHRLDAEQRRRMIIKEAHELAHAKGLYNFSRSDVAARLPDYSESSVRYHFKTMFDLRKAIADHAVSIGNPGFHRLMEQVDCIDPLQKGTGE